MAPPSHPKQPCFMKDFAALDSRSTHAHLRGDSWRARTYVLFEAMSHLVGRRKQAAVDYRHLSQWLYRHRERLTRYTELICTVGTAIGGMTAGMMVYLAIQT